MFKVDDVIKRSSVSCKLEELRTLRFVVASKNDLPGEE